MTDSPTVIYERRGAAAWISLSRPERRNALSKAMIRELVSALDRAEEESDVRAVVMTGSGRAFCSGADLDLSDAFASPENDSELASGLHPFARLLERIRTSPLPTVAAVNGACFGGGLGLVAASDVVVASTEAVFSFSEVRVGLIPAMISVVVLPRIGRHVANRLMLGGHRFSAPEAVDYQLVHRAVEAEELQGAVEEEVHALALGGPEALAACKRLLEGVAQRPVPDAYRWASEQLSQRFDSAEGREGMAAFREKRKPTWQA